MAIRCFERLQTDPTGTLVTDPRPRYSDEDPASAGTPNRQFFTSLITGGNVVDTVGNPVYVQTGTGDRGTSDPWEIRPGKSRPLSESSRRESISYYNEEQITITVPDNLTLKKVGNYDVIPNITNGPHVDAGND